MDEKSLRKWQLLQHSKFIMSKLFYKEWQTSLGLRLELMTLHMRFTISIEQDR